MAKSRVIVKRRKAVRNIRKITRTMQLIATARFQAAQQKLTAARPYAERINEIVQELGGAGEHVSHPLLAENAGVEKSAVVLITSNRGLCGGYNSSLMRLAGERLETARQASKPLDLLVIGRKGVNYYRFLRQPMTRAVTDFPDTPGYANVEPLAVSLMADYEQKKLSAVHVVFMRFLSVARQAPACVQLLPIPRETSGPQADHGGSPRGNVQYDISPAPAELLADLLPLTVKVKLFQCFLEANVSEQVARMVAMKSATDAADDMIKSLTRQYNRARQSQITNELLDIIGGAEALK